MHTPIQFFDSHAHFESLDGHDGLVSAVERATTAGVTRLLAVGGSRAANDAAAEGALRCPETVRAAVGYDRDQAGGSGAGIGDIQTALAGLAARFKRLSPRGVTVALGEIGLDFHYSPETVEAQITLFREQLALARELLLPVIVHSRDAVEATLAELSRHRDTWKGRPERIGVLHCFTGDRGFAAELLALDFCISFSGIITFASASALRGVASNVPDDRILIETDSPYLAPAPHRGKRNEPALVAHVAAKLAEVRGDTLAHVAELTKANGERLFAWSRASRDGTKTADYADPSFVRQPTDFGGQVERG